MFDFTEGQCIAILQGIREIWNQGWDLSGDQEFVVKSILDRYPQLRQYAEHLLKDR